MGKIETQPVRSNERAFLRHVFAEYLAERLVQKMGRRMIGTHRLPAFVIDNKLKGKPEAHFAFFDQSFVNKQIAEFLLGIVDTEANTACTHDASVANLAAGFAIERRLIEDDGPGFAGAKNCDFLTVLADRGDEPLLVFRVVAQ